MLTLDEISLALKEMKNKCPGVGIKYFVLRGLNYAYISGEMTVSLRTCIISCLPKGNKPC